MDIVKFILNHVLEKNADYKCICNICSVLCCLSDAEINLLAFFSYVPEAPCNVRLLIRTKHFSWRVQMTTFDSFTYVFYPILMVGEK